MTESNPNGFRIQGAGSPLQAVHLAGACAGFAMLLTGLFAWLAYVLVPPPNPWMMGEVAFGRILGVYAVAITGSLLVTGFGIALGRRPHLRWLAWLALPCAAFLVLILIRICSGLPLSIG